MTRAEMIHNIRNEIDHKLMPRIYSADEFEWWLYNYRSNMLNLCSLDGQLKLKVMRKKLQMLRAWDKRNIAWQPNIDRTGYYPNLVDVETDIAFWAMKHCYDISLIVAQLDFFGIFLDCIVGLLLGVGVYYGFDPFYMDPSLSNISNTNLDLTASSPSSETQDTVAASNTSKSDDTVNWVFACCAVTVFALLMISGHACYIK